MNHQRQAFHYKVHVVLFKEFSKTCCTLHEWKYSFMTSFRQQVFIWTLRQYLQLEFCYRRLRNTKARAHRLERCINNNRNGFGYVLYPLLNSEDMNRMGWTESGDCTTKQVQPIQENFGHLFQLGQGLLKQHTQCCNNLSFKKKC